MFRVFEAATAGFGQNNAGSDLTGECRPDKSLN